MWYDYSGKLTFLRRKFRWKINKKVNYPNENDLAVNETIYPWRVPTLENFVDKKSQLKKNIYVVKTKCRKHTTQLQNVEERQFDGQNADGKDVFDVRGQHRRELVDDESQVVDRQPPPASKAASVDGLVVVFPTTLQQTSGRPDNNLSAAPSRKFRRRNWKLFEVFWGRTDKMSDLQNFGHLLLLATTRLWE